MCYRDGYEDVDMEINEMLEAHDAIHSNYTDDEEIIDYHTYRLLYI